MNDLTVQLDEMTREEAIELFIRSTFAGHRAEDRARATDSLENSVLNYLEGETRFAHAQAALGRLVETVDE